MNPDSPKVEQAEKQVGAVLEKLEADTGVEVKDIGLEDMVDTEEVADEDGPEDGLGDEELEPAGAGPEE